MTATPTLNAAPLEAAVRKLHAAKGRYHTQLACCDLYDLLGLPNVRPGQEPETQPNAALADGWMDIATHDGRKEDVQLFCADTGEQFVGFPGELVGTFQFAASPSGNVVCSPTHYRLLPAPPTLNASKEGNGHG